MDLHEIHLPGGRVARFRILKPTECDKVAEAASIQATNETPIILFERMRKREGAKAMLVQVTKDIIPVAVEERTRAAFIAAAVTELTRGIDVKAESDALVAAVEAKATGTVAAASYVVTESQFEKFNPASYEDTFGPKDDEALRVLFGRYHEASAAEVGAILGKARMVTT